MVLDMDTQIDLTSLTLKAARERAGLSHEQVKARSGISLQTIQSYERRGHSPQYSYLLMLLEAYGMDLGGFYELLTDLYAERQRGDMEERIARAERRIEALKETLTKINGPREHAGADCQEEVPVSLTSS